jgi:hypothetical protein
MAARKKYSSPNPETGDVATLLACIETDFGYKAGIYIIPTSRVALRIVCEVGHLHDAELTPTVSCEETATSASPNLTASVYRAALRAYWATEAYCKRRGEELDDDMPF